MSGLHTIRSKTRADCLKDRRMEPDMRRTLAYMSLGTLDFMGQLCRLTKNWSAMRRAPGLPWTLSHVDVTRAHCEDRGYRTLYGARMEAQRREGKRWMRRR